MSVTVHALSNFKDYLAYGILEKKPPLPEGFTLVEARNSFLMARGPDGSMYFCGPTGALRQAIKHLPATARKSGYSVGEKYSH